MGREKENIREPKKQNELSQPEGPRAFTVFHGVQKNTPNLDEGFTKSSYKDKLEVNSAAPCGLAVPQSWAVAQFKLFPAQGML